ncbi:hypothetical protein [Sphingomonas antarctica]|uniref:hypothetical protein n=1 Tax=Sphingomonas antarctica TaxID=2040274 RepID=UPI0039E996F1
MTNADLAEQLNDALGLTGSNAVTPNVIRQWVLWDLLPKATIKDQKRGDWTRDARSLRRATRLAELRKLGVKRETAFIVQAYLEWGHGEFNRVREAALSELRRSAALIRKAVTSDTQFDNYSDLSGTRQRALRRQGGPLDNRFRGTVFEQSREFYAWALKFVLGDAAQIDKYTLMIGSALSKLAAPMDSIPTERLSLSLVASVGGLFGDAEEVDDAGETALSNSSERDFRVARLEWKKLTRILRPEFDWTQFGSFAEMLNPFRTVISAIGPQITVGNFAVSGFTALIKKRIDAPELILNC